MTRQWYQENLAAKRRERFARKLKFAIFNKDIRARLDKDGRILPCSQCRVAYRHNLIELICDYCRSVNAADAEWRESDEYFYRGDDAICPRQAICARCRDHEPAPESCNLCAECIGYLVRNGLDGSKYVGCQLSLDFEAPDESQPQWFKLKPKPFCQSCGKTKASRYYPNCGRCSKLRANREPKHPRAWSPRPATNITELSDDVEHDEREAVAEFLRVRRCA
jgi:hypothetical protein